MADLFAREGATVLVNHFRDAEAADATVATLHEASAAEGHAARPHGAIEADVSDAGAVARMFAEVEARAGALHILVNNAGMQVETPGESFVEADFMRVIGVDLLGPALCSRAALAMFLRQAGTPGTIINTTSLAARQAGGPGTALYGPSKAFVQTLTRYLAHDHAQDGIRVNAVAPGFVLTPLQERNTSAEQQQRMASAIPLGRAGVPEDLVGAYLFLASDAMSGWITGATIDVNGGAFFG